MLYKWKSNLRHSRRSEVDYGRLRFRVAENLDRSDSELRSMSEDLIGECRGKQELTRPQLLLGLELGALAIQRTFGFLPHDVQVLAATESARGRIVEMKTGEGKTVVAALTAYLLGLFGQGVHVATTNDYLAERDCKLVSPFFDRLGMKVGLLERTGADRRNREANACDVTYGPGYQFGFDFLIDQITLRRAEEGGLGRTLLDSLNDHDLTEQLIQVRGHGCTVIDEADSVLIDEATTPLILSGGLPKIADPQPYVLAKRVVEQLEAGSHFDFGPARQIYFTERGKQLILDAIERHARLPLDRPWINYIENALRAKFFFHRDEHYVVLEGKIRIVDQFTGRIFDDRTWQHGLQQAVEAKEGLTIYAPTASQARITRQRYYQKYKRLTGMSGTVLEVASEFGHVYRARVVSIPTHVPCKRKVLPTRFFRDWETKLASLSADVQQRHSRGQPILIGTRTIRESCRVVESLSRCGIQATLLNGVQDAEEAEIVAQAGWRGAVTVATNMAGRGTDIKLGEHVLEAGGLHVIGTEPHSSNRIDQQLIGRCARQGDPGSAQFYVSAEDEFLVTRAPNLSREIARSCDVSGDCRNAFSLSLLKAQRREEQRQFQVRQQLIRQDNWLDEVRRSIAHAH